jgi:hypothetical protein
MANFITDEEFNKLPGSPSKVITDDEFRQLVSQTEKSDMPTTGVWDAITKGFTNIGKGIKESGEQLNENLNAPTSPGLPGQFIKTAKTATGLIKGMINPIAELAINTPLRVAGEVAQSDTGYDVNEAISHGTQKLVQKGMDTEVAQKAMQGWAKLKETDPESAMALSAALDIGEIGSYAIGAGGASKLKSGISNAVSTGASNIARATGKVAPKAGEMAGKVGNYGVAQTFGLKTDTIKNIIKNPELFTPTEMAKINRESVFTKVKNAVDKRLGDLSETGKGYESIKNLPVNANVSEKTIINTLKNKGIDVVDGKIKINLGSDIQLSNADIKGLEEAMSLIKGKQNLTAKEVINLRGRLSNLAAYGEGKTDASKLVAKEIRKTVDAIAKKEIPGLAELDAKFAPERELMTKIKKAIFEKDGRTIKSNAITTITNLTGSGKEQLLARMEKIVPGITKDVNILKSIQDIRAASENKVGTYSRSILGVGGGALAGGPIGAVMGMIATSPQMGVAILRTYAKYKNIPSDIINGMINKMHTGKKLVGKEIQTMNDAVDNTANKLANRIKNIRPGLTIQDVSKKGKGTIPKIAKQEGGKVIETQYGGASGDLFEKFPDNYNKFSVNVSSSGKTILADIHTSDSFKLKDFEAKEGFLNRPKIVTDEAGNTFAYLKTSFDKLGKKAKYNLSRDNVFVTEDGGKTFFQTKELSQPQGITPLQEGGKYRSAENKIKQFIPKAKTSFEDSIPYGGRQQSMRVDFPGGGTLAFDVGDKEIIIWDASNRMPSGEVRKGQGEVTKAIRSLMSLAKEENKNIIINAATDDGYWNHLGFRADKFLNPGLTPKELSKMERLKEFSQPQGITPAVSKTEITDQMRDEVHTGLKNTIKKWEAKQVGKGLQEFGKIEDKLKMLKNALKRVEAKKFSVSQYHRLMELLKLNK